MAFAKVLPLVLFLALVAAPSLAQATPCSPPTTITTVDPPTKTYQACGGFRISPLPCPTGSICVDNPFTDGCGMACDEPGICVEACGGYPGLKCSEGKKCIDQPGDPCDPATGGRDCGGICVWE